MNNDPLSNSQQLNNSSNKLIHSPFHSNLIRSEYFIDKLGVSLNIPHEYRESLEEKIESYKVKHKSRIKRCKPIGGYKNIIVIRINNGKKKISYKQPPVLRIAYNAYYKNCAYASIEFNPASLTKFGKKQIVKTLRYIFGKKYYNKLYTEGMVTRLDIAMDLFGIDLWHLFFYQSHSQSSQRIMSLLQPDKQTLLDSKTRYYFKKSLETIYVGDQHSDFYTCAYDKNKQITDDSANNHHDTLQPRKTPWVRYEARFKNIKLSMAKLDTFKPNLRNIMILTYPEIISVLDNSVFNDIRPFFLASCSVNGLNESIKMIRDDNMRRKFKSLLNARGTYTINMQTDLDLVWRKLCRSQLRFLKPLDL
tara:strand:- start:1008 stop:2096 length:1089 start_codon:yes stop_codon:yes gene_type:complete